MVLAISGFFISSYVSSNDSRNLDCIEARKQDAIQYQYQIDYLRAKLDKQDSVMNYLYQEIAIKNGVMERLPNKLEGLSKSKRK